MKQLNFANIYYYEAGYFEITTFITAFSWGETVTLIFDENEVFINSMPQQPITIGRDRKNIRIIIDALQAVE